MKIIDTFIFYNELKLLNYRLEILNEYVDYFVIVESIYSFAGKKKELIFENNKNLFSKFKDKIIHIIVNDFKYIYPNINYEQREQWKNEIYQRNCIKQGLEKLNLNDTDIIIISDLDEIPNPNIINDIKNNRLKITYNCLTMDNYYYNLHNKLSSTLNASKIILYDIVKKFTIQDIRRNKININSILIEKGGWHLSYFGDIEFIQDKINNFSHQEYNNINHTSSDIIEERINNNIEIFGRKKNKIIYTNIKDNTFLPSKYNIYLTDFYSKN
jgi:hypothetical protein